MRLEPLAFDALYGWNPAEVVAAWPPFRASCLAILESQPCLRRGRPPHQRFIETSRRAMDVVPTPENIEAFFLSIFRPFLVTEPGFVTGYYQPELTGSLHRTREFRAPVLARPDDLIDMRQEGGRLGADGRMGHYPNRESIEAGQIADRTHAILWLMDHVEVYFAQVQGSARVALPDGSWRRLIYDGRNGRPYSSIGRILIDSGEISAEEMSLARCKAWLRANGLEIGEPGRAVLQRNESYVFFRLEPELDQNAGPIGGQGVPLTAMRSIAVDRAIWPYGTPVWIDADLGDAGLGKGRTGRMMIAQDTGSAIVGPARGDLFIGSGSAAGEIAGNIRHPARFIVFLPIET